MLRARRPLAVLGAVGAFVAINFTALPAATAAAVPPDTGCPAGWQHLSLTFLASQGPYHVPFVIDAAGNMDGYVCGKPVNHTQYLKLCGSTCDVPIIYNFRDNDLTPSH
jgi:hypothetical protein